MRRLVQTSLFALATLGLGSAVPSFAADQNTYRPGHAYLKTAANSFEACEQQCQGDAQCRGWNFVRPNPHSKTGICEFNERSAMPVTSAISISGEIMTNVDPLMSRAVPAGTRTRRVGTPETPAPVQRGNTKVNRMPVPTQRRAAQPTAHKMPAAQNPNVRQTRTYGAQAPAQAAPRTNAAPVRGQRLTPEQQYYRQQFLMNQQRQQQLRAQQQAALKRQQQMANPQMGPRPQAMPPQGMPPQAMPGPQAMPAPQAQRPQAAPMPQRAPGPISGPMVQKSLYGSLHDDLTKNMTPVPRPQTAPDNPNNPDAPLSTSRAVPSTPVETQKMNTKADPALAGG